MAAGEVNLVMPSAAAKKQAYEIALHGGGHWGDIKGDAEIGIANCCSKRHEPDPGGAERQNGAHL